MAARSNSKEDVYQWVWDIIASCENNHQHYITAQLIKLFEAQYQDKELVTVLRNRRMVVWDELYNAKKRTNR